MPLYWRYLLSHFLKILLLSVCAFVAILLTMRLDEIAQFAALGPSIFSVFWFALKQIPYIIPIALPISALIASLILVNQFSSSKELTAFRAAGLSLCSLFAPLLITAGFLSLMNFTIISEISTRTHLSAGLSKNQLRAINPLLLMSNKHVMKLKGFYFDVMGPSHVGEFVQDFVFVSPNKRTNRVNLMFAKKLRVAGTTLAGEQVTFLTEHSRSSKENDLVLENIQNLQTGIDDFSRLLDKKHLSLNNDHLPFSQLLIREQEAKKEIHLLKENGADRESIKEALGVLHSTWSEMWRRVSVGLAVFSFTLMGLAFGIHVSRRKRSRGTLLIIFLAALYLISFFIAKRFQENFLISFLLYSIPHLCIWASSIFAIEKISRGVEA